MHLVSSLLLAQGAMLGALGALFPIAPTSRVASWFISNDANGTPVPDCSAQSVSGETFSSTVYYQDTEGYINEAVASNNDPWQQGQMPRSHAAPNTPIAAIRFTNEDSSTGVSGDWRDILFVSRTNSL